jgi:hypothetical protein
MGRMSIKGLIPDNDSCHGYRRSRQTGTDAENKAVAQGSLAYYRTYTVDEPNSSVIMRIEHSSFPNFNGVGRHSLRDLETWRVELPA